jgi:hypothetical protein
VLKVEQAEPTRPERHADLLGEVCKLGKADIETTVLRQASATRPSQVKAARGVGWEPMRRGPLAFGPCTARDTRTTARTALGSDLGVLSTEGDLRAFPQRST